MRLVKTMAEEGLVVSCSQARRAIMQGGVKVNDVTVNDLDTEVEPGDTIQLGKRDKVRLVEDTASKAAGA